MWRKELFRVREWGQLISSLTTGFKHGTPVPRESGMTLNSSRGAFDMQKKLLVS